MAYILSATTNTNSLLTYDHDASEDHRSFLAGEPVLGCGDIEYRINKKSQIKTISKSHVIASTGPTLFSRELRTLIERLAPDEVEFFDAKLSFEDQTVEGFSAVNPLSMLGCVDMEKSEFKLMNFDPANPEYMFYYQVLLAEIPTGALIATCKEHPRQIIVGPSIKEACQSAGLQGLRFCRALDITPQDRSVCE